MRCIVTKSSFELHILSVTYSMDMAPTAWQIKKEKEQ